MLTFTHASLESFEGYTIKGAQLSEQLNSLFATLRANGGRVYGYGGFLRDAICLENNDRSGDIDVAMTIRDFRALKDPANDIRDHFVLHDRHLPYMIYLADVGKLGEEARPFVLNLKAEKREVWGVIHPVQLNLHQKELVVANFMVDYDLGFCGLVYDGATLYASQEFLEDYTNGTMTMVRCRNARDYARTLKRILRFQATGYGGWPAVIPERFRQAFEADALALLEAEPSRKS